MNAALILAAAIVIFVAAYFSYGSFVARTLGLDNGNATPAHRLRDGVDYVPAAAPVVFGHHFATIAGAGPIVGPILAIYFGWLPALLWILLGSVFVGAVHDFVSLVASVRHSGRSIGSIIEQYMGRLGKTLFLLFSFPALVLVIAVFLKVVVATLVKQPEVGTASVLFVFLAIGFGYFVNARKVPLAAATVGGVSLMAVCVWMGIVFPLALSESAWMAVILVYISLASILPVSFLLQPRDYLNSFLLWGVMLMAVLGIFFYQPQMEMPAYVSFNVDGKLLFPLLFVTVACGAVSGFHSLAASGTTSKQVDRETDTKPIGYGAMLLEGVLAVVSLITVAYLSPSAYGEIKGAGPITIFSNGVGGFSEALGIPVKTGMTFAALAISSFALTTLDSCVRLARFAFQELFSSSAEELAARGWVKKPVTGTLVAVVMGLLLAVSGGATAIWPIFGAANQLLGALALLAAAVWLEKTGRRSLFVKIPMLVMFAVSLSALGLLVLQNARAGNLVLAGLASSLLALAIGLAVLAYANLGKPVGDSEEPAANESY